MTQSPEIRAQIAALGQELGPAELQAVYRLYAEVQNRHAAAQPPIATDQPYGSHPRQKLDIYAPAAAAGAPVLLWVHGGGFLRGEKSAPDHPFNAHVGRWAARNGFVGTVMNYRLAPESGWPSGGEDVGAAIDWLRAHAARFGGDPARIVAVGTSAGAAHVATHLQLRARRPELAGAVLLSGIYGFTPLEERDTLYFGAQELYAERMSRDAVVATDVPLLVACAEFDPSRFQAETLGLLSARLAAHGRVPRAHVAAGHNHFSISCHLGTPETRLADDILTFIGEL